jgi:hypothetical protein
MAAPAWLDELHLEPGPPWHAMGTRSLDPAAWLLVDDERDEQLARKRALLADRPDVVAAALPGAEVAAAEAAQLVAGAATLEEAAVAVQEDLCVLVHRDGHWRLDAGVVCFPSMWRLPDKLGLPMAAVHGPVPGYADELAARVDRFLDRLRPERPVWRRNWFVHGSPELHLPAPPPPPPTPPDVPDGLWLRSERQTMRALPTSGGILFTIRTQQVPLAVVAGRPDVATRMATAVAAWSPELAAYRGATAWRDDAVAWLRSVSNLQR